VVETTIAVGLLVSLPELGPPEKVSLEVPPDANRRPFRSERRAIPQARDVTGPTRLRGIAR